MSLMWKIAEDGQYAETNAKSIFRFLWFFIFWVMVNFVHNHNIIITYHINLNNRLIIAKKKMLSLKSGHILMKDAQCAKNWNLLDLLWTWKKFQYEKKSYNQKRMQDLFKVFSSILGWKHCKLLQNIIQLFLKNVQVTEKNEVTRTKLTAVIFTAHG